MNLFLDDMRYLWHVSYLKDEPKEGWRIVRTVEQFEDAVKEIGVENIGAISFDHDLGTDRTGYDAVTWLEARIEETKPARIPALWVHSANPAGVQRIMQAIKAIEERHRRRTLNVEK